jgi:hypothetical protein
MNINEVNLTKKMDRALNKRPVDTDMVVQVLCESNNFSIEQSKLAVQSFLPSIVQLHNKMDKLIQKLDDTTRVSDSILAQYFLNNPYVLEGFDVVEHSSKDQWIVTYNGEADNKTMTVAYNNLTLDLATAFGLREISFTTLSKAIIKAKHWHDRTTNAASLETAIIETALSITHRVTIPELKKALPSLRLKTKEIEKILLDYGWQIKTHNNSRVKYFYREH